MTLLTTTALLAALVTPLTDGAEWMTDFAAAKASAKAQNKDLLIDFTGSDWCGWCIRLKKEVFSKEAFKDEIHKHFVLVELDYPRKKKLPDALAAQNEKLKNEYAIRGYPTIFLTDADGRPYARTGYRRGGPEKYLEHLAQERKKRSARDEHFQAAAGAKGVERAKHLAAAIDALGDEFVPYYQQEVAEICSLDASGEAGLKNRFSAILAKVAMEKEVQAAFAKVNKLMADKEARAKNAAAGLKVLRALSKKHPKIEGRNGMMLASMMAGLLGENGEYSEAIEWMEKLKKLNPRSGAYADRMIEDLKKKAAKVKAGNAGQ